MTNLHHPHLNSVIMGIDEAGRGAVLGPMTYGAAYWAESINAEMVALNFDDSKAMTEAKRAGLFERLKKETRIGWMVKLISAEVVTCEWIWGLGPRLAIVG